MGFVVGVVFSGLHCLQVCITTEVEWRSEECFWCMDHFAIFHRALLIHLWFALACISFSTLGFEVKQHKFVKESWGVNKGNVSTGECLSKWHRVTDTKSNRHRDTVYVVSVINGFICDVMLTDMTVLRLWHFTVEGKMFCGYWEKNSRLLYIGRCKLYVQSWE